MHVFVVCPAPRGSRKGNRVSAERWRRLLDELGHQETIAGDWQGEACDVLLAMHARKSYRAIRRYRREHPRRPLVVALTGTDLYRDLPSSRQARQSLQWADRLIGLHDQVGTDVPASERSKVRVILQSTTPVTPRPQRAKDTFNVCVLGHLRGEKDPLRTALALRRLRHLPQLRVVHAGEALTRRYATWAKAAQRRDSRYRWLGEIPRARALHRLASSHLMVISSRMEGGANVVSEAIVNRVPILASDISGNRGLLGSDYAAYYPVGDTVALAQLLERACTHRAFYAALQSHVNRLAPRFTPAEERQRLAALLHELAE